MHKEPLTVLAIQRRSQRVSPRNRKVFKQRRDKGGTSTKILLRIEGGRLFHTEGPTMAKARCWAMAVLDTDIRGQVGPPMGPGRDRGKRRESWERFEIMFC